MSKSYKILLSSTLVLFLCLLLMLCYFNRLATDDYYFIWDVRNHGVLKGVTSQYFEWCGRFAATFFMDVFYKVFDVNYSYYSLFPFISAVLVCSGIYFLINNLTAFLKITLLKTHKLLASASFTALLFFLSIDIGESWFWFCGMSSYLWSIIAFIWGIVFLSNSKNTVLSVFAAIICFIYVGGASEVYSAIYGLLITTFLIYKFRQADNIKAFIQNPFIKKLLIVYIILGISFIIFLIAPGNYLRDGLFPDRHFFYSFFITAKSIAKFGLFYLPFKIPYILLFAMPFLVIGESFKSLPIKGFSLSFKSFFFKLSGCFQAILVVFFITVSYVMVETGPARIWFLVSFLLAVYSCMVFFYAGYKGIFNSAKLGLIKKISAIFGIGFLLFFIVNQYAIASNYANANDKRIAYITDLNKRIEKDTLIILDPLPPAGMLYSSEIAADTNHFTNRELRLGYDLKFHVVIRK